MRIKTNSKEYGEILNLLGNIQRSMVDSGDANADMLGGAIVRLVETSTVDIDHCDFYVQKLCRHHWLMNLQR